MLLQSVLPPDHGLIVSLRTYEQPLRTMPRASDDVDLGAIYAFAVQLGKDAGDMLMKAAQARFDGGSGGGGGGGGFEEKESAVDIVTKTDEGTK